MGGQKSFENQRSRTKVKIMKNKFSKKEDFLILFLNLKNLIFFLKKSLKNYKIILKNHGFLIKNLEKLSIKNKIKKSTSLEFFLF